MSARSGISLVEMLVACALTGVMLALLAQLLLPVMRAQLKAQARSDLQMQAVLAVDRMARDLRQGTARSLCLSENPPLVGVDRLQAVLPDGQQSWEDHVVLFGLRGRNLVRQSWPPGPGRATPLRLTPEQLQALAGDGQVLAREVDSLSLQAQTDHLEVDLKVSRAPETFELRRVVWLRNGT